MITKDDVNEKVNKMPYYSKRYKKTLMKYFNRGYMVMLPRAIGGADAYDREETYQEMKAKPTANDMVDLEKLLLDFEIKCDLPDFKSRNEMYRWKRKTIKDSL